MKNLVAWYLDHLCAATGHFAGCGLLNRTLYIDYNEETDEFRWEIPSPLYRIWCWSLDLPSGRPRLNKKPELR